MPHIYPLRSQMINGTRYFEPGPEDWYLLLDIEPAKISHIKDRIHAWFEGDEPIEVMLNGINRPALSLLKLLNREVLSTSGAECSDFIIPTAPGFTGDMSDLGEPVMDVTDEAPDPFEEEKRRALLDHHRRQVRKLEAQERGYPRIEVGDLVSAVIRGLKYQGRVVTRREYLEDCRADIEFSDRLDRRHTVDEDRVRLIERAGEMAEKCEAEAMS